MRVDYVGYVLAVASLIYAYYLYKKGIRTKEPVYSIKSVNVISDFSSKYDNLTVSYKGEKVENFTVSKILFYNRGAETITRQDIETLNHLRILSLESNVLDVRVLQVNNNSSDFKVNMDREHDWVVIDFDYLNTNHGAVIEIVHTGTTSENIGFLGDIKGVQKLTQIDPKRLITKPGQAEQRRLEVIATFFAFVFWYITTSGRVQSMFPSGNPWAELFAMLFIVTGLGATIVSVTAIFGFLFGLFNETYFLPNGLEKFTE